MDTHVYIYSRCVSCEDLRNVIKLWQKRVLEAKLSSLGRKIIPGVLALRLLSLSTVLRVVAIYTEQISYVCNKYGNDVRFLMQRKYMCKVFHISGL